MSGKKTSKSSKTEHVLNLLAGTSNQNPAKHSAASSQDSQPEHVPAAEAPVQETDPPARGEAAAAQSQPVSPPVQSRRITPPILEVARSNNEALSETIHGALEAAFEEELAAADTPLVSPEDPPVLPVQESLPSPEPPSAADADPQEIPAVFPEAAKSPAEVPVLQEDYATPEEEIPPAPDPASLPGGEELINIMELLVEGKLSRYVQMFHLCGCPRCLADTKALALTRLPAKYVVLSSASKAPMLSLYEAKFDSDVTTQIIYACKTVMEHPRHTES